MTTESGLNLADFFGVSPQLLPHLPELLSDFTDLGSDPDLVVSWLQTRGIDSSSRVLDLACGKGAAGIGVARTLGASVTGVDAFAPFIETARTAAEHQGVGHLCRFQVGDIRAMADSFSDFDAVLYLSIGDALGYWPEAMGRLRRMVRPGGYVVAEDAYRLVPRVDFPGYERALDREQTLAGLTAHGDRLIEEKVLSPSELRAQNRRYQGWIEQRAAELTSRKPDLAQDIAAYVEREYLECILLEMDMECASWLIEVQTDRA